MPNKKFPTRAKAIISGKPRVPNQKNYTLLVIFSYLHASYLHISCDCEN
jgi:hypothetical protein